MELKQIINRPYELKNGVYDFISQEDDFEKHESELAGLMSMPLSPHIKKEWEESKKHFWSEFIKKEEDLRGKKLAYLGCGNDLAFKNFSDDFIFINVDIVDSLLNEQLK